MTAINPIAETADTVTLSRSDWEALLDVLEDAEDLAAVSARRAEEAVRGKNEVRRNYLTGEEAERLWAGESSVKVWREKRRLTTDILAAQAAIPVGVVDQIEAGEKPGSPEAIEFIARVLQVLADWLADEDAGQEASTLR